MSEANASQPRRRICVVSTTRADYGLLRPVMRLMRDRGDVHFQLVAGGMHLVSDFGSTLNALEADGFRPDRVVDFLLASDTPIGVTKSLGLATIAFAEAFDALKPDLIVLLGDRYEILAAGQAALIARIPIAHIHGGELTHGAFDDAIRHCLTKMASLHFASTEEHCRRVIQMGESPDRVFNVGAPGLDSVAEQPIWSREETASALGISLATPVFVVTFHPATAGAMKPDRAIGEMLTALDRFDDATIIMTKCNADPAGRALNALAASFVLRQPERRLLVDSLGTARYINLLRHADVVVGNSSSGIIEAPIMGVPTVNIGDRQAGRPKAASVIDCDCEATQIGVALKKALGIEFRTVAARLESPYGRAGASAKIYEILRQCRLAGLVSKGFRDITDI